jgi:hypothetical protein
MAVAGMVRRRLWWTLLVLPAILLVLAGGHLQTARGQVSTPSPVSGYQPNGPVVRLTYEAGWNIVAAPQGAPLPPSSRGIYTFPAGATGYTSAGSGASQPGVGYWEYFNQLTPVSYPGQGPQTFTVTLPAAQYVLIGNPAGTLMLVTGADALYTYDPIQGYQTATVLQPGQGAWAFSRSGGALLFTNVSP